MILACDSLCNINLCITAQTPIESDARRAYMYRVHAYADDDGCWASQHKHLLNPMQDEHTCTVFMRMPMTTGARRYMKAAGCTTG